MPNQKTPQNAPHHHVRTFFAAIFGTLAVSLVLSSLVIVWLNRTLTDTSTYVKTVTPLATKPAIQNLVAQKVSQQIIDNATTSDLASTLLPAQVSQQAEVLKPQLQAIIEKNILTVVQSPAFLTLWTNTNQTAHASLIKQLNDNTPGLTINLQPVVDGVLMQLKTTQLAPFVDKLDIKPNAAVITLKNSGIEKAHTYYQDFQKATWFVVFLAAVFSVLTIVISVNHAKTFRRTAIGAGVMALLLGLSITIASKITINSGADVATRQAAVVFASTLLHNLQMSSLLLGITLIVAAVVSKLISKARSKKA